MDFISYFAAAGLTGDHSEYEGSLTVPITSASLKNQCHDLQIEYRNLVTVYLSMHGCYSIFSYHHKGGPKT